MIPLLPSKILFKKWGITTMLLLLMCVHAMSQVSTYTFSQSSGTFTPITGGTVIVSATDAVPSGNDSAAMDDYMYAAQPLPFTFNLNGVAQTTFRVNSNGWFGFGTGSSTGNTPISTTITNITGVIDPFSADLMGLSSASGAITSGSNVITGVSSTALCVVGAKINGTGIPAGTTITAFTSNTITLSANATSTTASAFLSWCTGEIRYETLGTAPNRIFVVQFTGLSQYSTATSSAGLGSTLNYQIQLAEGGGVAANQTISIVYGTFLRPGTSGTGQVGIRGPVTTDYNNRTTTTNWSATTAGSANTNTCTWSSTVFPASGLTFIWTPPAACNGTPAPGNTLSTTTSACQGVNFTLSTQTPPTGTGLSWQWESAPAGTGNWAPIANATATTYTTNQTAATDYRVTVTCNNGGASGTSNPITVNMGAFYNCYCTSGLGGANYAWIDSVSVVGSTLQNGPTGMAASFYTAYPASGNTTTDLSQGEIYTLYTRYGTSTTTSAAAIASLWIDYNQNGTFEASEWVQITTNAITASVNFTVPVTATLGQTGMRIRSRGTGNTNGSGNACTNFGSGETEDYIVNIIPPPSCPKPTTPAVNNITANTADIHWNTTSVQSEVEYGMGNFVQGTGTVVEVFDTTYNLSGLAANTAYSYFVRAVCGVGDTSQWTGRVSFTTLPTCPAPTTPAAGNITLNSADLSWVEQGSATLWEIEYGPGTFTVGNGTRFTSNSNPYSLSGLNASTTYSFYVRSICSPGDTSAWSASASFSTPLANDDASGAVLLTVGAGCSSTPYNNTTATQSANEPFTSCKGTAGYGTVWFKFVAPSSGAVKISDDFGGTLGDSRIALFAATDSIDYSTFSIIACDDDNGVTGGTRSLFYATGLIPGNTYYVLVDIYVSTSTRGTFCVAVDELSSAMLSASGSCTSGQGLATYNAAYTGWLSLTDNSGKLVANVRQVSGAATGFTASLNVNTGGLRNTGSVSYLDRNYLITSTGTVTAADLQLFFTDADLSALGATISSLNVTRQTGSTCVANFTAASGTNSLLTQTANGSINGANWITVSTPGFSNFYIMDATFPLSVDLGDVSATNVNTRNRVDWNTLSEKKGDYFVVERSVDGSNYTELGTVAAKGEASTYSYWDQNPVSGVNYYRLQIVDAAGSKTYSKVVTATVKGNGGFSVEAYPNPVRDVLTVKVYGTQGNNPLISVSDVTGKVIKVMPVTGNEAELNMSSMSQGIYLIRYSDNSHSQTIKVNKQ